MKYIDSIFGLCKSQMYEFDNLACKKIRDQYLGSLLIVFFFFFRILSIFNTHTGRKEKIFLRLINS